MGDVAILILAAGKSSRMGGADKLLELVDERPLLRRVTERVISTGCQVFVTLPPNGHARLKTLSGLPVVQVEVAYRDRGLSESLRAGINVLPKTISGVMVVLGDMPDLTSEDFAKLLDVFNKFDQDRIVRAVDTKNTNGHPIVFPKRLFAALRGISGDTGALSVVKGERIITVPLPDGHASRDLDTPADWIAWRLENPHRK